MRFILAGLGGWGRVWTRVLREAKGAELVAVADPAPGAREWAVRELGLPGKACHESLEGALERARCDAVILATPMWTHHAEATAALRAGKHVLCEKPLTTSMADALSLAATAESAGRVLMVDQNYRFRRPARAVREVVAGGALGELLSVRILARRNTRTFWSPDDFRYAIPHFYLLNHGIHHFDLLRAVTGRDARSIYSRGWRVPTSPYHHDAAGVSVIELEGGARVVWDCNYATPGPETGWNGEWELVGERGRLSWRGGNPDANTGELTLEEWSRPPRPVDLPELPHADSAAALQAFISAVETGVPPVTSVADNLRTLAIVFGSIESAETGGVVRVADLLGKVR